MKKSLLTVIITSLIIFITGCGKVDPKENTLLSTEMLNNPEVPISEAATERDYGDKEIIDGNWRYVVMEDETNGLVAYIPLYKKKNAGVYDLEDYYNEFGTGKGAMGNQTLWAINQPKGTIQGHYAGGETPYLSKNRCFTIENNVETKTVSNGPSHPLQLIFPTCYTANKSRDSVNIEVKKADIVCYTFALYEDISQIPKITISFLGVDEDTMKQYYTFSESLGFMLFSEKQVYKDYLNASSSLTKLGSFDITDSGVRYVDLKSLTKGVDYYNVITVIEFDSLPEDFSYYMTKCFAYDITDSTTYEAWKKENVGKFFE